MAEEDGAERGRLTLAKELMVTRYRETPVDGRKPFVDTPSER
jgi:hypothetical protein